MDASVETHFVPPPNLGLALIRDGAVVDHFDWRDGLADNELNRNGFAVDENTLSEEWEPLFLNVNDGTCEGIRHRNRPFFSTQFHPEASGGPTDTEFLFDDFIQMIEKYSRNGQK